MEFDLNGIIILFCIIHSHGRAQTSLKQKFGVLFPLQNPTGDPQDELLLSLFQSLTRSFISPFCGFDLFREGSLLDIQPGFLFPRVLIVLKLIPLILSQSLAVSPPSPSKQLAHYLHILLLMIKLSHHLYLTY